MGIGHLFAQVEAHQTAMARTTADREVRVATNRAAKALRKVVSFNAVHAEDELNRIAATHRSALRWSLLLDGVAVLCGVALALAVFRRFRAHDKLLAAHNALVEQRAAELEVFGSRVAHDLLSPLSALTYCLAAFKRASEADPKLQDALTRARTCVTRAQAMVHGIFEFSRAGGAPEAGGHADLREVVEQVAEEIRTAEAIERPDVTVEPFEPCILACSPGVLGSVLSNLLRNAAKYMSDSALKQITVRVRDKGSRVRVEVEDTGPGIPAGLEGRIFEPYVRAEGVTQAGLGLGLATVKRLCEAYGGSVGVRSRPGEGSVFWFTLPKASSAAESTEPVSAPTLRRIS
jgi:signal transduction histidine kinase